MSSMQFLITNSARGVMHCLAKNYDNVNLSAADYATPDGVWVHYKIVLLTYLLTYLLS